MHSIVARLLLFSGLAVNGTAGDVHVIESEEMEDDAKVRVVRFSARLARDEVLVVRCERRQDDRVVLETEETYGAAVAQEGAVVRLRRLGPDGWQIGGAAEEQYLQGVSIATWERSARGLHLAFTPDLLRARRRHALTWTGRVEKWTAARRRHPALPPPDAPAENWPVRSTVCPAWAPVR